MTFTVRAGPLRPPILETDEATSMELRDSHGKLVLLILMIPSGDSDVQNFLVANCNEPGFEESVKGLGFSLIDKK